MPAAPTVQAIRVPVLEVSMQRERLIAWLRDAHAMERHSVALLRKQTSDPREPADARLRLEAHLRDTERHVERLGDALRVVGAAPAAIDTMSNPTGILRTLPLFLSSDRRVETKLARFLEEQFEVAAYTALIAAAEHAGEAEVARLCRLNRSEDEEMAEWLDAHIAIATVEMLGGSR